ncbi:MAG TPA: hypothetical protein VF173_20705 [Thermoanaerobaculia bacterium]|nr:hypothetical protein [Thermoanaerobaculia bacterium]
MIAPAEPVARIHPFPGLRPFEPDEDHFFFGREQQIDELLRRLRTTRFLAILGTSGCGKSSLVRSGLIPSLYGGAMTRAGSSWRIAILRPGEDPIGNLAAALDAPEALGPPHGGDGLFRSFFETTLRASNQGLVECVRQSRIPPRDNVLVLVDQLEELFRFKASRREQGRDEAVAFVKLLLEASCHEAPVYIASTMRSDFIGNCLELPELPEAINEGLYLVPRMTRDELRAAITGPVAVGGAAIAPRLVSRLLNDIGDDSDQLPILQHALMRTWDRWDEDHEPGEPLDLRHYEAVGTMKEALSRHAEEALGELDERGRAIAETLFRALTELGGDGKGTRRPVRLAEVCALTGSDAEEIAAVAERFRQPGRSFLMPPAGVALRSDSVLDLSHESLMRIWERLHRWAKEEGQSAQIYIGLARAAARHESGASALWRDPELQIALNWRQQQRPTDAWAARYDSSFERALRFLDASAAERDQEVAQREKRRRRKLRQARTLTIVFAAVALGLLALGVFAFSQKAKAEAALRRVNRQNREIQEKNESLEREKRRADAQRREALRQKTVADQERGKAEQQTRLTEEQRRIADEQKQRAETEELQARASEAAANAARLESEGRRSEAVQERERADRLRAAAEDSERETKRLGRLSFARVLSLQLTRPQPDDQRELAALLALQVFRLNRQNGGEPQDPDLFNALRAALGRLRPDPVLRLQDAVRAATFVGDGATLVAGSEDGKLLRFDLRRPDTPEIVGTSARGLRSVAASADGTLLAAGTADGGLRTWSLRQPGSPPRELASGGPVLAALAFQPRSHRLAAGDQGGGVRLWDLDRPDHPDAPALRLDAAGRRVTSLAFSPDGRLLAAGLAQGGALLWETAAPQAPPQAACSGQDVRSVAFSPDGKLLSCGGGRGEIVLWNPATGSAAASLTGHLSSVNALSFDPRGDALVSASSDGTVRRWDVRRSGTSPITLSGHESWVWAVSFSPEGDQIVSGGSDKTVRIWAATTERLAGEICRQVGRRLTREEWERALPADLPFDGQRGCPPSAAAP